MFNFAHKRLVWWPVELKTHAADGTEQTAKFQLLFQPLTRAELAERRKRIAERATDDTGRAVREIAAKYAAADTGDQDAAAQAARLQDIAQDALTAMLASIERSFAAQEEDVDLLAARTRDWKGVREDGATDDVEFSTERLRDLLAYEDVYAAAAEAFDACCRGAVRKNSSPGPAGARGQVQA